MIDIEEKYLAEIRRILQEHVPDCEVRLFGSRINGKSQKFSDIDLALAADEKLDWRKIESLKDALAGSDLPMLVDVHDYNSVTDEFRAIIDKQYEIIQKAEN
ncbi:MAG: nucleotidyltransferase domain-containing protein [Phycisphaerae bacterium]|jgi:predicted nucleotidyltransferase